MVILHVNLLDEGVTCWRPVTAFSEDNACYRISDDLIPDQIEEAWEFQPGDLVRCQKRDATDGSSFLAATSAKETEF